MYQGKTEMQHKSQITIPKATIENFNYKIKASKRKYITI